MTPKSLMLLGSAGSLSLLVLDAVRPDISAGILLFGFAALFGKGYGIWEERSRPTDTKSGVEG